MADDKVLFLDTTLRDGEQSAGIGMTGEEKMEIARQLQKMRVDIIEAGFAASSPGDFEAVSNIAREVKGPIIASLARAVANDIDQAWEAVKHSDRPRIHVFLSSSEIHQMHQLRKNREEVMEMAVTMVERAKGLCDDVEFSPMDATRTNREYLFQMMTEVIRAGATTINIADTVGYAIPSDFADLLRDLRRSVPGIDGVTLSVHCHNDLGLAVANSLAAIQAGALQVEGCINGIGERAGNASLEEIIMAVDTRKDLFKVETSIDTTQIYQTSRMVSRITGMLVQANKAVVGENAFRHASGIHQDGVLKDRSTYEVMQPERVGVPGSTLVLGKLSGRAGLQARLEDLGYQLSREEISKVFESFKVLADKKREVTDRDLEILMDEEKRIATEPISYTLDHVQFTSGDHDIPTATVRLIGPDQQIKTDASTGNGPVDAVCNAIDRVIGCDCTLVDFNVQSVTAGMDSMGSVTIRIEQAGQTYTGRGASTDIIVASAKAYLSAVNRMLAADEEASLPPVGTTPD
ncbi:MAG: 2-isopropylmalate synthase [Chloroflexi bacterium]|nr:2-isopropylmalate synthase [Chloroflexota bacterium]MCI0798062.1 2-isopropylmalate synthase [Chloroflexota bacterium]MCI0823817.1 2-isopropylmalate synthase [Chloroflexota bacterium]MCI0858121.1 2-isopropylmalate synthase [Chloroflexota bacterium]MCI0866893.1 2-isopropylmalate synthase [Chloroflexota bacterium]